MGRNAQKVQSIISRARVNLNLRDNIFITAYQPVTYRTFLSGFDNYWKAEIWDQLLTEELRISATPKELNLQLEWKRIISSSWVLVLDFCKSLISGPHFYLIKEKEKQFELDKLWSLCQDYSKKSALLWSWFNSPQCNRRKKLKATRE